MIPAAEWQRGPMLSLIPGLNCWQFGPRAYRSMQPAPGQIADLARQLHLTTILDLTADGEHDADAEAAACRAVPINSASVPMDGVECPTQTQIDEALGYLGVDIRIPDRPIMLENAPGVLIHCTHGEDRSGVICACYQLVAGMDIFSVIEDFGRGHARGAGLVGEYWMIGSILEFAGRLRR